MKFRVWADPKILDPNPNQTSIYNPSAIATPIRNASQNINSEDNNRPEAQNEK